MVSLQTLQHRSLVNLTAFRIDENTLVIRESKVDISTTILMSPHKIPYGNTHVADMIKKALGPACEGQQDGICDPTSTALKQPTQVYGGENEFPPTYTMSFDTAGTHFAEFMVTNYVTALANMGAAFETSKTESWRVCEGTDCDNGSPPVQGSGTFYYGPMNFNLERKNTTTSGTIDTFIVTVRLRFGVRLMICSVL